MTDEPAGSLRPSNGDHSIAVGFVVDDAVVEIENIVRHMEDGLSPD
jgi:Cu/Ag efflux pump CusA